MTLTDKIIKKSWRNNIIWVIVASALVMFGGELISMILFPEIKESKSYLYTFMSYFRFITMWISVIFAITVFKKNRYIKESITMNNKGNKFSFLAIGLIIGFLLNGLCGLMAWFHGDIHLKFARFDLLPVLGLFVVVFIQSSAEEVLCRGFMYKRLLESGSRPIIAIILNAFCFALAHLGNDGMTALAFYDLFISGIFFSLIVYYFDSLWMAMSIHATWNFTQSILLGLPNSGASFPYSIYKLSGGIGTTSFAYDTGFGLEGTVLSAVLMTICCIALWLWNRKDSSYLWKKNYS